MEENSDNTELWLTWNDHAQIFKNVLSSLRYREQYADVKLVCGGKHIPAHRFVLSTCSAFFEKLLETIPGPGHPMVVLTNTSPKEMEALLDFMYLGQTEVSSSNLDRLLDIAYELKIRGLISERDDPENQEQETVLEGPEPKVEEKEENLEEVEMADTQENDLTVVDTYVMPDSDPLNTLESQEMDDTDTGQGARPRPGFGHFESPDDSSSYMALDMDVKERDIDSLNKISAEEEEFIGFHDNHDYQGSQNRGGKKTSSLDLKDEDVEPTQNGPEETGTEERFTMKVEEGTKQPALDSGIKEYKNFIQKLMQQSEEAESLEVTPHASIPEKPAPTVKKISKPHDSKSKKGKPKGKIEKYKTDAKKQKEKLAKSKTEKTENTKEKVKPVKNADDNKTKIMMCPGCKKTFMSQSVLEAHMKTHDDLEIVSCAKCPFKALSQQQMQKHMLSHQQRTEQKSRPYRCPYCPARQVDRSSLLRHQKTLHPGKKVVDTVMKAKVVLEDCKYKRVKPNKLLKDYVRS